LGISSTHTAPKHVAHACPGAGCVSAALRPAARARDLPVRKLVVDLIETMCGIVWLMPFLTMVAESRRRRRRRCHRRRCRVGAVARRSRDEIPRTQHTTRSNGFRAPRAFCTRPLREWLGSLFDLLPHAQRSSSDISTVSRSAVLLLRLSPFRADRGIPNSLKRRRSVMPVTSQNGG
jgi:hypothetical protein